MFIVGEYSDGIHAMRASARFMTLLNRSILCLSCECECVCVFTTQSVCVFVVMCVCVRERESECVFKLCVRVHVLMHCFWQHGALHCRPAHRKYGSPYGPSYLTH